MSETDNDTPELNPSVPVEKLAYLIKNAAELQVRLCMWRVSGAADFHALEKDVRGLEADVRDLQDEIKYEKSRMGIAE